MIDPLFSFTIMSLEGRAKSTEIAVAFSNLLFTLEVLLPGNSREFAIAKTKLEEVRPRVSAELSRVTDLELTMWRYIWSPAR